MTANHWLSIPHSDLREQKGEEVIDGIQGIDRQILDTCGIPMQNWLFLNPKAKIDDFTEGGGSFSITVPPKAL